VIATKDDLDRKVEGQTIASRWLETMAAHSDNVALRAKDGDRWVEWTYADVGDRVARAAAGLRTLGVGPGDRVVLMMRNIPEFHVVDLATMFCGATAVSTTQSTSGSVALVASPECKTAVDRANSVLAVAVRMRAALTERTSVASGDAASFDRALAEYRQVVDRCTLRAP